MKKVIYYNSYDEDIVESDNQDYKLKDNYKWIHNNIFYRFFSSIIYVIILLISFIYMKLILKVKIIGRKKLKKYKGYYLYSNHTQILGDVFVPFIISFPHHPRFICSPSNLGIRIIGRILPIAGALPIPEKIHDLNRYKESIKHYTDKGNSIIIYPEAHLWPWYTKIRDFPKSSFHFPSEDNKKVFVATTTYKKKKEGKKPKIIIYIDGPFNNIEEYSRKENIDYFHDKVFETMTNRSKLSNYDYIEYKKVD